MVRKRGSVAFGLALAGAGIAAATSCKPATRFEDRPLVVYSPKSCPVSQKEAYSVIYGNGDFADSRSAISSLYLREIGREMSELPNDTRSVIVDVSHPSESVDWRGIAEVPASGPIHVLVWPGGETCRLTRNVEARADVSLGVFGRHLMVAGGRVDGQVPPTFVGDLTTGIVSDLEFGLATARSHPTITAFRETPDQDPAPALVAGGEDADARALSTGEIYLPKVGAEGDIGDFDRVKIDIGDARTRHGAVVLGTGETLLVGGIGSFGVPLATMEIIDPKTHRYRTSGVATLLVPRSSPTVLRLASGEIMVAGGFDRSNLPVPTIEWFSHDVSRATKHPIDLVTGAERAFVPLEAGGALAVVRPGPGAAADFSTVYVISADGTPEAAVPIDPTTLDVVRLFPGTDGAPVLWTGQRWLRWEPWFGAFQPIADAPTRGPRTSAMASGDSGLALWLDDRRDDDESKVLPDGQLNVRGYRFATRSRFGTMRSPLLVDGPAGLAPDRVVGTPGSAIRFVEGSGLELGPGASAFVTDVTFRNVGIVIDGGGSTPYVVLRQENGRELEVGGAACGFTQSVGRSLAIDRAGPRVVVRIDDGEPHDCPTTLDESARVSVGVRGADGTGASLARNLRILRR